MKTAVPALQTFLASATQTVLWADLYTFSLQNGFVARYAVGDSLGANASITSNSFTYDTTSLVIKRGKIKTVLGCSVDSLELTVTALPTHLLNGTPFMQACRLGLLDAAIVRYDQLFQQTLGDTTLGTVLQFSGRVADMDIGRWQVVLKVHSDLELLTQNCPRNVFQPGCLNTLYDAGCTMVKASFGTAGSVLAGSTKLVINNSIASVPGSTTLAQGTVSFTSGLLSGLSATISTWVPGTSFTLIGPLIATPSPGDTFTVYPGCDKQQSTCSTKWNNLQNYRGYPFVPPPEAILQ